MISNNEEQANEEGGDEYAENRDEELRIETAGFYIVPTIRNYDEGKKSIIHAWRVPVFSVFRSKEHFL